MTQQQLALEVGIDPAYTGRIERGLENVSIGIMEALAKTLDVPMAELFAVPGDGEKKPDGMRAGRKKSK